MFCLKKNLPNRFSGYLFVEKQIKNNLRTTSVVPCGGRPQGKYGTAALFGKVWGWCGFYK